MRVLILIGVLLAGAAEARECKPPRVEGTQVFGFREFAECTNAEIADLKKENARLTDVVEKMEKTLAGVPGEMTNTNGRVVRSGGDNLVRAVMSLDGRARQAAMGMNIDQKALEKLCGEGCSLTLVLTGVGLREGDPTPVFVSGPCAFQYKAKSGAWTRGGACGAETSGVDGNGLPTGATGGEIIATAGEACMLADSGPRRPVDPETEALSRDREKGLVLIADPGLWTGSEQRFRCDLSIVR